MKIQARVKGMPALSRRLREYPKSVIHAAASAAFVEGEQWMGEMKPLVPVDEGILRSSGHVQLPEIDGRTGSVLVKLGFGGPAGAGGAPHARDVGYAVRVHDNERVFGTTPGGGTRNTSPNRFRRFRGGRRERKFVGQSGYMKVVVDRKKVGFAARFAKRMVARLRGVASL